MDSLKKVIGVFLILVAAAVALHTVLEPLYYTSTDEQPYNNQVWLYLNILSAISVVLGIIISYVRKSNVTESSSVQEYIAANTLFFGFMFAAIFFFWNWFGLINPGGDFTPTKSDTGAMVWIIFDAILPLLNGALGMYLLRSNSSE